MASEDDKTLVSIAMKDDSRVNFDLTKYCYDYMNRIGFYLNPLTFRKDKEETVFREKGKLYKGYLEVSKFDSNHPHLGIQKGGSEKIWKDYLFMLWQKSKGIASAVGMQASDVCV